MTTVTKTSTANLLEKLRTLQDVSPELAGFFRNQQRFLHLYALSSGDEVTAAYVEQLVKALDPTRTFGPRTYYHLRRELEEADWIETANETPGRGENPHRVKSERLKDFIGATIEAGLVERPVVLDKYRLFDTGLRFRDLAAKAGQQPKLLAELRNALQFFEDKKDQDEVFYPGFLIYRLVGQLVQLVEQQQTDIGRLVEQLQAVVKRPAASILILDNSAPSAAAEPFEIDLAQVPRRARLAFDRFREQAPQRQIRLQTRTALPPEASESGSAHLASGAKAIFDLRSPSTQQEHGFRRALLTLGAMVSPGNGELLAPPWIAEEAEPSPNIGLEADFAEAHFAGAGVTPPTADSAALLIRLGADESGQPCLSAAVSVEPLAGAELRYGLADSTGQFPLLPVERHWENDRPLDLPEDHRVTWSTLTVSLVGSERALPTAIFSVSIRPEPEGKAFAVHLSSSGTGLVGVRVHCILGGAHASEFIDPSDRDHWEDTIPIILPEEPGAAEFLLWIEVAPQ